VCISIVVGSPVMNIGALFATTWRPLRASTIPLHLPIRLLCPTTLARSFNARPVRIRASSAATDAIAVHDRRDLLGLEGAALSASKAYKQAKVTPKDIDLFELHDAFTIMSVLSLEACGFAERGRGVRLGTEGDIAIGGQIPITTMGGLKARGHPVGATGIYQVIEVALQMRQQA